MFVLVRPHAFVCVCFFGLAFASSTFANYICLCVAKCERVFCLDWLLKWRSTVSILFSCLCGSLFFILYCPKPLTSSTSKLGSCLRKASSIKAVYSFLSTNS